MKRQTWISTVLHLVVAATLVLGLAPPVEALPVVQSAVSRRESIGVVGHSTSAHTSAQRPDVRRSQ